MKKIVTIILLICMALTVVACTDNGTTTETTSETTTPEITMQGIYDAVKIDTMLKNHDSVYIRDEMDGELFGEKYLTKDYAYDYFSDEDFSFVQFMTEDACYYVDAGERLLYLFITPDGVGNFASEIAGRYESVILSEEDLDQIIESVSEKDGRIIVSSVLNSENLESLAEEGVADGKFEYVLDAKTRELLSVNIDYSYEDGLVFDLITEINYDAEEPEMLKEFLGYVNQTENLRNVTVVTNLGTEKEEIKSIQAPKGLIIGFEFDDGLENAVEFYTDADFTESYDPYADTESDLTVYVKWTEQTK